ncbi:uncharacterized protein LOC111828970 [Capsella rubella]|uniref:uncharacterized protein LOC111828970 n=1 Tax=Capsella rubella TaxID=81985 RepID=UPI000CD513D2|nr:uncharacterized protein LOC111828970 [Capsella rubella]
MAAMAPPVILIQDAEGTLRDGDGHSPLALNAEADDENRTLGEYNRPALFYSNCSAIRPPAFQRNNFELKPGYDTLVGQHPFHSHTHEHPMDHIEKFEDLLKELKPASFTCWKDVKVEFLNNFYDDARSKELQKKISTFSQGISEAFKAAWVRFKGYQRDCPHHGYDKFQLLGIFYRGLDWRYQMALDAASNGNYNTRSPAQATKLIENLATSNSTKVADFERKKLAQNMDGVQLAEVKAKLDSVHNLLVSKKTVKFAAEVEEVEPGADEEEGVNYVSGAGYLGQKFGNTHGNRYDNGYGQKGNNSFVRTYGNSSYQSPPPPSADTEMKSMLEQILVVQQNITVDFNGKMDALYTYLNGKIEALSTFTNKLDVKVAQTTRTVKKREGCNAILIRDGDDVWEEETSEDDETVLAQQVSLDTISGC